MELRLPITRNISVKLEPYINIAFLYYDNVSLSIPGKVRVSTGITLEGTVWTIRAAERVSQKAHCLKFFHAKKK